MRVVAVLVAIFLVSGGLGGPRGAGPQCPQIKLRFGRVRYRQRGKIARFVCNNGYMLAGDRYSVCAEGRWDNVSPRCVRATCQKVKPPANGLIFPSHSGAVLNFFCKSNFELRGPNATYCDGDRWDNALPACLPSNSTPPLSCDFESEDICGWNHDPNHDFDWKRMNFATPSGHIGTGPSSDHTKGEGRGGYYMYIESSARNPNDTAHLISPIYDSGTENVCFQFYYHMYGSTTGDLRVYLRKTNETSWNFDQNKAIFAKSGNQGNRWYRAVLELGVLNDDYQIIIEGVRGPSYISDIAIDDVKIIPKCSTEDLVEPTTEVPSSTEQPISVESCENRCQTNDTQETEYLVTCDCDDGCFVRNRCCPDYFDFCAFSTSIDDSMEDTSTVPVTMVTSPTTLRPTTKKATTVSTTTTVTKKEVPKVVTPSDEVTVMTAKTEENQTPGLPPKEIEPEENDSDKAVTQKIIIPYKTGESNTRTVIFAVGVVFGALFAAAGMAFVARRYRLFRCRGLRRLNQQSSNGDSQSDVRFLTGEEILDLNLPSDYSTL